jgi:serine/threonine protein kinase/tetratricopeptide (TPR) repeat protein
MIQPSAMVSTDPAYAGPPQRSDLTGKMIGRFEVRARLGAGGMGEVYRADDTRLKRPVALKRVSPELRSNPRYAKRLLREAELASGLSSPNIAAIYDAFEEGGEIFLVMEYLEGENLRRRLARPLPLEEFLGIATQCAGAIAAAQKKGIVHGDIKPENIMLMPTGQVKILDFGVAKRFLDGDTEGTLETIVSSGWLGGTPAYMAPEVLDAKDPDSRADIFGLGVVFYESLTGQNPFQGGSFIAIANRIMKEQPPPLCEVSPKLPAELGRIVGKMLAKDPAERYTTAADLGVDLRALQRTTTSNGRQSAPGESSQTQEQAQAQALQAAQAARRPVRLIWLLLIPLAILLLAAIIFRRPSRFFEASAPPHISSLAVLPLKNDSGDASQEYFADGMTDALTSELAGIESLRVVSRTSAMLYKNAQKPLPQIARELHVDALIEGSVMRDGDRVRITAKLIQASPERTVWTQHYERNLSDVLTLQGEVARNIADEINASLTQQEQTKLSRQRQAVNPAAYEEYLRGLAEYNKRTEDGLRASIQRFRQAIEEDPQYAPAYAALADSCSSLANYPILSPKQALAEGAAAAEKALQLDNTLSEAHSALAWVHVSSLQFGGAEAEFQRAIELDPSNATARHHYGLFLAAMGRKEDSLQEMAKAQEIDPLSLIISANIAWCHFLAKEFDEAIRQARSTLAMDPKFAVAHEYLGQAYTEKRQYPEAIAEFREAVLLSNNGAGYRADLAYALALGGNRAEAENLLRELTQESGKSYVSPYDLALIHLGLGDRRQVLDLLDRAYEERSGRLMNLRVHPWFDSLRGDARFQELLRRTGLDQPTATK